MIGYSHCPYCDKETEINYEGEQAVKVFRETCRSCNRSFEVYYQWEIIFFPSKLDEKEKQITEFEWKVADIDKKLEILKNKLNDFMEKTDAVPHLP